ncbi:insulin-like 0 [Plakobranchus ocellatus]|uniref:Insulin-like 0 n=1 Tax=Plakobranchus ocellatus TaxID=259542 RepID=A0AAV4C827_9GAST|nr:insulin-like 0 [Plakobranchus ocellatus]
MSSSLQTCIACLLMLACLYEVTTAQSRLCGRALADTLDMVCSGRGFHLGKRSVRGISHVRETNRLAAADDSSEKIEGASEPEEKGPLSIVSLLNSGIGSNQGLAVSDSYATNLGATKAKTNDGSHQKNQRLALSHIPFVGTEGSKSQRTWRTRRNTRASVVDECCLQSCTFATLESYCAAGNEPVEELSMDELRRRLGLSVNGATPSSRGEGRRRYPAPRPRPSAEIIRNRGRTGSGPFFYLQFGNQATRSPLVD